MSGPSVNLSVARARSPKTITLRGRVFTRDDIKTIKSITKKYFPQGRTKISEKICEALNWKQPNGWLKDRACRDVLRTLDHLKVITLPSPKLNNPSRQYSKWRPLKPEQESHLPIINTADTLTLILAKGNIAEKQWNKLVQQYHYLGHKISVGRCLKFLIQDEQKNVLAALSLVESAWNVKHRDEVLSQFGWSRDDVANNGRFLIPPNVRVKNLASRCLAILAKKGAPIWNEYYSTTLKCLETFVDTTRFVGTSYLAANWLIVGKTKGYRKSGPAFFNSQTPKLVLMYPLDSVDRKTLSKKNDEIPDRTATKPPGNEPRGQRGSS